MATTPQGLSALFDSDPTINHNGEIISIVTVFSTLSLIALALRLISRRIKRVGFDWDDYLVVAAWMVTMGEGVLVATSTQFAGLGQHVSSLTAQQIIGFKKGFYILPLLQTSALCLGKLSVLFLLHRIFITPRFQITVRILAAIVLAWFLSSFFGYVFMCYPIQANWNPAIHATCGNSAIFTVIVPIPWVLTDFAILFAPIPEVKKLQLPRLEKIGICALFLTGGLTCIVATYRYSRLFYPPNDLPWDLVDVAYWSVIETNVTVLCACVVAIKPALKYLFPEKLLSSTRSGWSRFLSSRSGKSTGSGSTGSGSTGSGSKEKSSEYSSGSFERLQDRPPHLPLYNESADRFGSRKLDDGQHVPLSAIFVERSDSWAKGAW